MIRTTMRNLTMKIGHADLALSANNVVGQMILSQDAKSWSLSSRAEQMAILNSEDGKTKRQLICPERSWR